MQTLVYSLHLTNENYKQTQFLKDFFLGIWKIILFSPSAILKNTLAFLLLFNPYNVAKLFLITFYRDPVFIADLHTHQLPVNVY